MFEEGQEPESTNKAYSPLYQRSAFRELQLITTGEAISAGQRDPIKGYDPAAFRAIEFGKTEAEILDEFDYITPEWIELGEEQFAKQMLYTLKQLRREAEAPWTPDYRFCVQTRKIFLGNTPEQLLKVMQETTTPLRQAVISGGPLNLEVMELLPRATEEELRMSLTYSSLIEAMKQSFKYSGSGTSIEGGFKRLKKYERAKRLSNLGLVTKTEKESKSQHLDIALLQGSIWHLRVFSVLDPKKYTSDLGVAVESIWHDFNQTMAAVPNTRSLTGWNATSPAMYKAHTATVLPVRVDREAFGLNVTPPMRQGSGQFAGSMWGGSSNLRFVAIERDLQAQNHTCPICDGNLGSGHRYTTKHLPKVTEKYLDNKCDQLLRQYRKGRMTDHSWDKLRDFDLEKLREWYQEWYRQNGVSGIKNVGSAEGCFVCSVTNSTGWMKARTRLSKIPEAADAALCQTCWQSFGLFRNPDKDLREDTQRAFIEWRKHTFASRGSTKECVVCGGEAESGADRMYAKNALPQLTDHSDGAVHRNCLKIFSKIPAVGRGAGCRARIKQLSAAEVRRFLATDPKSKAIWGNKS